MTNFATDTKIYLAVAILFPIVTAVTCWVAFTGVEFMDRWRVRRQRKRVDSLQRYVDGLDMADETYGGVYDTPEAQRARAELETERAKLEMYESRLLPTTLESVTWPRK